MDEREVKIKDGNLIGNASDDGRLYGSITTATIAAKVNEILGLANNAVSAVTRIDIILKKPIKDIGVHEVKIDLYSGIVANVKVVVGRSESEAEILLAAGVEAAKAADAKAKKADKTAEVEQAPQATNEEKPEEKVMTLSSFNQPS